MEAVFPTCLAPLTTSGILSLLSFHAFRYSSIFRRNSFITNGILSAAKITLSHKIPEENEGKITKFLCFFIVLSQNSCHFAELYHKIPGWQGLRNHKKRRSIPLSSQGMGRFSKEGLPRPRGHSPMLSILSSIVPAGAFTSTVSPALWPIRACPIGDFMEILPSCMLASCGLVRV